MKNNIKTYGKQGIIKREYLNLKQRFNTGRHTRVLLSNMGMGTYTPKVNKIRLGASVGLMGLCIILPFTPEVLLIPHIVKWGVK